MIIDASKTTLRLLGGALCLNFVNTRSWYTLEKPADFLMDYPALLQWSLQLGLLTQREAARLAGLASRHEDKVRAVMTQAIALRESIYGLFAAPVSGQVTPARYRDILNSVLAKPLPAFQVVPAQGSFAGEWWEADEAFDRMLRPIAHSAAELLSSEKRNQIKHCEGCGGLFLDPSRAGRRRWCAVQFCGNQSKAHRHPARKS